MYFVNRDAATKQLLDIHVHKFSRAETRGGDIWRIPIVDNVSGMGKSTFACHYIRKCREIWKAFSAISRRDAPPDADSIEASLVAIAPESALLTSPTKFQIRFWKTLCACRTVHITFQVANMVPKDAPTRMDYDAAMVSLLKAALEDMFEVPPQSLANPPSKSARFLQAVTKEIGLLFIVLDKIGRPFDDVACSFEVLHQRELFLQFCRAVLFSWLELPNVFFVVVGCADFMSLVQLQPSGSMRELCGWFQFERLRLELLRPAHIATIMKETRSGGGTLTLQNFYRLDGARLMDVAKRLFVTTNGHPRTLAHALSSCRTYESLMHFVEQPLGEEAKCAIRLVVEKYRPGVEFLATVLALSVVLVDSSQQKGAEMIVVDMSECMDNGDSGEPLTLDFIVHKCGIAWEGTLERAALFASAQMTEMLVRITHPFRPYAAVLARLYASGYVPPTYATAFEWVCLKRLQELFVTETSPTVALPEFFEGSAFGTIANVRFNMQCIASPRITDQECPLIVPTLDSPTAAPTAWPTLLLEISTKLRDGPVTIKPEESSASADAILFSRLDSGTPPSTPKRVLTVGLAAKISPGPEFGTDHLLHECEMFNRMFFGVTSTAYDTNVLVVCATSYMNCFMTMFDGGEDQDQQCKAAARTMAELSAELKLPELIQFSHITEIIFLNLTTRNNRAAFYGYETDDEDFGGLEKVLEKKELELEKPNNESKFESE